MKSVFFLAVCCLWAAFAPAQTLWNPIPEAQVPLLGPRWVTPEKYHTQRLDVEGMALLLAGAPERFGQQAQQTDQLPILTLPTPEGGAARFYVVESSVMHPDLQARHPETRCYTGYGIDDATARLRCDLTPWGFHAMVRSAEVGSWFIEPYSHGDRQHYMVYYKKDNPRDPGEVFECLTEEENPAQDLPLPPGAQAEQGDCQFRRYRLAVACTGEYASFHGGTVPLVAAAIVTSVNRVVGVYEDEIGVTLQLVANNNNLIYLNASTDPYTNGSGGTMLGQNQTTCDAVIGTANYDIGHVFSTGGGGVASLGSVCSSSSKARGVTGRGAPIGDLFDIDYVAHEIGHQFRGSHCFNTTTGGCGGNISTSNAMEIGSGQTIMAYAGLCSPNNSQNFSDPYFHAISLANIAPFVTTLGGSTCDQIISTGNSLPTANAGADYIIPISTPFALTADGSDPNGDPLSYCWEQMDNAAATYISGTGGIASTNPQGPNFRSFLASSSPTRFFPRLQDIINNVNPIWERLPSVNRTLNFRVTVRDLPSSLPLNYGCTAEDNMVVTVTNSAGPFLVTEPNTAISYPGNSSQTINWNVANTTAAPVSCPNVNILLSTDGGFTFPTVLAANTPNDGSEKLILPNINSTTCRIKVECANNIFFDMSNANFTITAVAPVEMLDFSAKAEGPNAARLQWATASENNNRGFDIEAKADADADFRNMGFVAGKGNSGTPQRYTWLSPPLPEDRYVFRLKQVDFDGKSAYSPLRSLDLRPQFKADVFPNPLQGDVLNVRVFSAEENTLRFELFNMMGQRVLLQTEAIAAGQTTLRLSLAHLPEGCYHYVCRGERHSAQGKLLLKD
jgi:hypothetical protein